MQDTRGVAQQLGMQTFSGYSRHLWSARPPRHADKHNELAWVKRWYSPDDLRTLTPVQRHKFVYQHPCSLASLPAHWVPLPEVPLKSFSRAGEEKEVHASTSSSRCEQWSTLRQMLPSKGHCTKPSPPKWGTGTSQPPGRVSKKPRRFPHLNSPMTE